MTRRAIKTDWVVMPALFGEPITWPAPFKRPGSEALLEFGNELYPMLQRLLDEGKIKPHPVRVMEGDLNTVLEAMKLLRSGKVSGEKLVVRFK